MNGKCIDVPPVKGMEPHVGLLLAMLDDNTQEWREELGEVAEEVIVWQPFPDGHSIGAILLHIADVEAFWLQEVAAGRARTPEMKARLLSEATDQYAVQWPAPPKKPLSWYYEQMDEVRTRTRQTIRELNNPLHTGTRRGNEFTLRWLLHHVITHEAYHGGQAVLLKLIGGHLQLG